ncbi:hypothetical protein D3C85_1330000 [compost metagenome]
MQCAHRVLPRGLGLLELLLRLLQCGFCLLLLLLRCGCQSFRHFGSHVLRTCASVSLAGRPSLLPLPLTLPLLTAGEPCKLILCLLCRLAGIVNLIEQVKELVSAHRIRLRVLLVLLVHLLLNHLNLRYGFFGENFRTDSRGKYIMTRICTKLLVLRRLHQLFHQVAIKESGIFDFILTF